MAITAVNDTVSYIDGNGTPQEAEVEGAVLVAPIPAGSALIGHVGIDQTTPGTTNGVQINAALPAGENHLGTVDIALSAASGVPSTGRLNASSANNNPTVVKASQGCLYGIVGRCSGASTVYLKFYNKSTAPTVGTDTPFFIVPLTATANFSFMYPMGVQFSTGISFGLTTAVADGGTTAVSANDVVGLTIHYV